MNIFLLPLEIILPLILVLIMLIIIIWILYYKNRQLNIILINEKQRFSQYKNGITQLKSTQSKNLPKTFETLNKFVRAFFKEYYNLNFSQTYLELNKYFLEQKNTRYASFCKEMSNNKYSRKEDDPSKIENLIEEFYNLLLDYESNN